MNAKICDINGTIRELIEKINNPIAGFAFIVENDMLVGLKTDGDIRRALLKGLSLDDKISDLNIEMCEYAFIDDNRNNIVSKLNDKVRILPLVDNSMRILDFIQFDKRNHVPIAEPRLQGNELKYLTDALLSTWISSAGEYITRFEEEFSKYIGSDFGVCTSNGTTALHLSLLALGIGEGDEVILPGLTFASTANSVLHANATPVIVDVELDTWCIDPKEIEKAITPNTKAIIPVHLFGQACKMDKIMEIANKNNLYVIEDCAEAHGATFNGKKVGSFGDISCFSFFANKIITTGEGGMCLSNSSDLNQKMRQFRDHGMNPKKRYWHDVLGYNYRMTNMQAAIGCAQLERIEELLNSRDELEDDYNKIFSKYPKIDLQKKFDNNRKVTWLVSCLINIENREAFLKLFRENKVDVRPFFFALGEMNLYKPYIFGSNENCLNLSKYGYSFPTVERIDLNIIDNVLNQYFNKDES